MKVSELIEELKGFNQNLDVVVDGYEGGVTEISPVSIGIITVVINANKGICYYGEHEAICEYRELEGPTKEVLWISR